MAVHFGTDGIRGRADDEITPAVAYRLGVAVARVFGAQPVIIGYDTRASSPALAAAAAAGASDAGAPVTNLGVVTTPGVAVVCEERRSVGIVVSASHNPYYDNGLKVLGVGGGKLDYPTEQALEAALAAVEDGPENFESLPIDDTAIAQYIDRLVAAVPAGSLNGLRIVLDCANGAASDIAPAVFRRLGADVDVLSASPDGTNINLNCGSTHPERLQERVRHSGADLGLAFDGDADRLVAVDDHGVVRDGDDLMVLFALDRHDRGVLGGALVVTSMSNLGLRRAMRNARISVIETDVGDRNVLLALEENGLFFGGEQSGHLIFRDLEPTGDGTLSGLLLCELVARTGRLSQLADDAWRRLPQQLLNVPAENFDTAVVDEVFAQHLDTFGVAGDDVRLLVRPSGTEPVVRIMVEASDGSFVDAFIDAVAARLTPRG